jgi:hypothetical protein
MASEFKGSTPRRYRRPGAGMPVNEVFILDSIDAKPSNKPFPELMQEVALGWYTIRACPDP